MINTTYYNKLMLQTYLEKMSITSLSLTTSKTDISSLHNDDYTFKIRFHIVYLLDYYSYLLLILS